MIPLVRSVQSSRKRRTCERVGCEDPRIEVGQPYVRLSLPPGRDVNGGDMYWMMFVHPDRRCSGLPRA